MRIQPSQVRKHDQSASTQAGRRHPFFQTRLHDIETANYVTRRNTVRADRFYDAGIAILFKIGGQKAIHNYEDLKDRHIPRAFFDPNSRLSRAFLALAPEAKGRVKNWDSYFMEPYWSKQGIEQTQGYNYKGIKSTIAALSETLTPGSSFVKDYQKIQGMKLLESEVKVSNSLKEVVEAILAMNPEVSSARFKAISPIEWVVTQDENSFNLAGPQGLILRALFATFTDADRQSVDAYLNAPEPEMTNRIHVQALSANHQAQPSSASYQAVRDAHENMAQIAAVDAIWSFDPPHHPWPMPDLMN